MTDIVDTDQLEAKSQSALAAVAREIANLRQERKEINVRLVELDLEKRRMTRIVNAFKPRTPRRQAVPHDE